MATPVQVPVPYRRVQIQFTVEEKVERGPNNTEILQHHVYTVAGVGPSALMAFQVCLVKGAAFLTAIVGIPRQVLASFGGGSEEVSS